MIRSLDTNLVSKNINWDVFKNKKSWKKNWKKKNCNFFGGGFFLLFLKALKFGVREGNHPVSGQSGFWKFAGLLDRTWCPVEPYHLPICVLGFQFPGNFHSSGIRGIAIYHSSVIRESKSHSPSFRGISGNIFFT